MDKGWQHNYELGRKAFDDKNYPLALQYLEKVAAEKGTFADVFNMLGIIYYNNSRFDDAIAAFKKAIAINPNYTEAALSLSVVYNELGKFDSSNEVYARAREARGETQNYLDPYARGKLANMHAELGNIYRDLGFCAQAVEEYSKALELCPEFVDIRTSLGVALRDMKDFDGAIRELEEAVRPNPDYAAPRIQLGLTHYLMGQNEKAKTEWLKVLRKHPENRMARMYMNLLLTPSGGS